MDGNDNMTWARYLATKCSLKVYLQKTGWLQYLPFGILAMDCFLGAALIRLCFPNDNNDGANKAKTLARVLSNYLGPINLGLFAFEIITVKGNVRPFDKTTLTDNKPLVGASIFDVMKQRRSCRSFRKGNLTNEHRSFILNVAKEQMRPENRIGKYPIRFEHIQGALKVFPVVGCQEFLVAIGPKEYDRLAIIDVGRCLQKVVIEATRMGIESCWIGPGTDHGSVMQLLGPSRFDNDKDHIILSCAFGYGSRYMPTFNRLMNMTAHNSRIPLDELFYEDCEMTKPIDITRPPYDQFGRCYEACRSCPSSTNSQPTRAVVVTRENSTLNGTHTHACNSTTSSSSNGNSATKAVVVGRVDFYSVSLSRYYDVVALGIWLQNWELGCQALGINGHFAYLTEKALGLDGKTIPVLPRYHMSWVAANNNNTNNDNNTNTHTEHPTRLGKDKIV